MKCFLLTTILFLSIQANSQNKKCLGFPESLGKENSKIKLSTPCEIKEFDFKLHDEYGSIIYSTTKFDKELDLDIYAVIEKRGKTKPQFPSGTYYYVASYKTIINGQPVEEYLKGKMKINSEK